MKEKQRKTRRIRTFVIYIPRLVVAGVSEQYFASLHLLRADLFLSRTKSVALLSRIGSVKKWGQSKQWQQWRRVVGVHQQRKDRFDQTSAVNRPQHQYPKKGASPVQRAISQLKDALRLWSTILSQSATFVYRRGGQGERTGRTEMCCR